uniref:Uncharacterized protein n=1 Tax=Solanum tuberosum TaxID=4113 RepID=M1DRV2_SOLTU
MIQDSVAAALPGSISSALTAAYPDYVSFLYKFENQQVQNPTSPNEELNGITDDLGQSDAFPTDNSDGEPVPSDQINSSIPSLRHSERKTFAQIDIDTLQSILKSRLSKICLVRAVRPPGLLEKWPRVMRPCYQARGPHDQFDISLVKSDNVLLKSRVDEWSVTLKRIIVDY